MSFPLKKRKKNNKCETVREVNYKKEFWDQ